MVRDTDYVLEKLEWMEARRIWPNGLRYLWTDAFGLVLFVSLYHELGESRFLDRAISLVRDVDRILGRPKGYRIGEEPDRDGQYFHYLAMWMYALGRLGRIDSAYTRKAIDLVRAVHPRFLVPDVGVVWKMREDLSGPYPGYGLGALDAFHGWVVYSQLAADELQREIGEMRAIVERTHRTLHIDQDLGLGMMLWMTHLAGAEPWAALHRRRSLDTLARMWIDPPGYYCRHPEMAHVRFAFTNYGVSLGLQAADALPEHVAKINDYFKDYRSGDEYDTNAITHVMACTSHFPGEWVCPDSSVCGPQQGRRADA
jgi:hypothetical protein